MAITILAMLLALPIPADGAPSPASAPVAPAPDPAALPTFETVVAAPVAAPPPPPSAAAQPVPAAPARFAAPLPVRADPHAAPEPMREGFYLRMLQGVGYAKFHGTGPQGSLSASGLASHSTFAIGGGLARGLALAGTIQTTAIEGELAGGPFANATVTANGTAVTASPRAKLSHAQIGALVDWYPNPLRGFHGGLSVGFGALALVSNADDSQLVGTATSGTLFVGHDFAIARAWALGLALVASGVTTGAMKNSDGDETGYKLGAYSLGFAASLLYY